MTQCGMRRHPRYAAQVMNSPTTHFSHWLQPDWPAIAGVHAVFTTRQGGHSQAPWDAMNLGDHVGDNLLHVQANRALLAQALSQQSGTPVAPVFLQQVHGCDVQALHGTSAQGGAFDACVTQERAVACTIMVADCLPVLLAHRSGAVVGAAHAGWRGLVGEGGHGVVEALWEHFCQQLSEFGSPQEIAAQTQVWLGPCIGPDAFEVGDEVRQAFVQAEAAAADYFQQSPVQPAKWLADLAGLARLRLANLGMRHIYGNDGTPSWCTVSNRSLFFSHRRDAAVLGSTGRMAACIWKV